MNRRTLNTARVLAFTEWFDFGSGYDRDDRLLLLRLSDGPTARIEFVGGAPGTLLGQSPLVASRYRLLVDGKSAAEVDVVPGQKVAAFLLPLKDLAEGWRMLDIVPSTATDETAVPTFAYVQRGGRPVPQALMPVMDGSFTLKGRHWEYVQWAWVPARLDPIIQPYPYAKRAEFGEPLVRRDLVMSEIVPHRPDDITMPRDTDGVVNTECQQSYYLTALFGSKYPTIPSLDGARGAATCSMATHLQIGRNGGVYVCDAWRVAHIQPDGTLRTLAGWRHDAPAPRPAAATTEAMRRACVLVGDWSAIPAERHGFHELWGLAWDARTTVQGSGPPIPNPPNGSEQPHDANPVAFVADSQNGRVCRLEFNGRSHATPCKVTEFITGLRDPWDVICVDGVLYVSERLSHRIAAYDARTGAFLRVVVNGAALATLTPFRLIQRNASLSAIRAERCVLPEGMFHQDGWLYYGSFAMAQVRRVHLTTGELQVVANPTESDARTLFSGGGFFKIAVSDGTFGPKGTVFVCSWASNTYNGRPWAFLPDGKLWAYGGPAEGPGRVWVPIGYSSAVAVGQGRMVCSGSDMGLFDHYRASGEAVVRWTNQDRTRTAYFASGLNLTHGPGGWGYYGLPMPWSVSADIDYHLSTHGHIKP